MLESGDVPVFVKQESEPRASVSEPSTASDPLVRPQAKRKHKRKTGRPCNVCKHKQLAEIDKALLEFDAGRVAARFSVAKRSVQRHAALHLPSAIVESDQAMKAERTASWWKRLYWLMDKAMQAVELGRDVDEISKALTAASKYMQQDGKALKILEDSPDVFLIAGFKDEAEARSHREQLEAVRSMSDDDIHASFMDFERRYALEAPGARRDYLSLLELSGGPNGEEAEAQGR